MRKVYLVKKDVNKPTCADNWIQMNSYEFYRFMQTEEGKSRCVSFGCLCGCDEEDTMIIAECGVETAQKWKDEKDAQDYRKRTRKEVGYTECSLSYSVLCDGELVSEEWVQDEGPSVEDQIIRKMEYEELYRSISKLPRIERIVIEQLFFNTVRTEEEVGKRLGLTRSKVHYLKSKALERLKTMLLHGEDRSFGRAAVSGSLSVASNKRTLVKPEEDSDNAVGSISGKQCRRQEGV